jgi:eukaryotic-like serine/threonine-protein kinase
MSSPVSEHPQHIDILCRIIQRRGWASAEPIQACRNELPAQASGNDLLERLLERKLIDRSQAKELRLSQDDPDHIEHYRLLGKLGSGAMGTVYLAENEQTTQRVALKVINTRHVDDDEFVNRFRREAKLVRQLDHPHIGRAVTVGERTGQLYLALEYINGPSFSDLLKSHGPLPEAYLLQQAIQIAEGLHYAYNEFGLVHRDMKPENVLLQRADEIQTEMPHNDDVAKIIDFGLAKAIGTDQSLTMTGLTMGTPHYMSPEQICGRKDLDCRADIYGLGCTMYHLLAGKTPYKGDSPGGIMMAHINDEIPNPRERVPGLHEPTCRVLAMAMAKERDQRYSNFVAFAEACREALASIKGELVHDMRLLRKPLVVNKPKAKRESQVRTPQTAVKKLNDQTKDKRRRQVTSRIVTKHQHGKGSGTSKQTVATQADPQHPFDEVEQEQDQHQAEHALRAVQSDWHRVHKQQNAPRSVPASPDVQLSAAFKPDAEVPTTLGLLPWMILAIAVGVLALILWL